jgi:uncharacterized repeat protein (TIGR01451 family)
MIRPRYLIHLALVAALLLVAPTALADPGNGKGSDKCSAEHPGNGHRCPSEEEASAEDGSSSEEPSEGEATDDEATHNEQPNEGRPDADQNAEDNSSQNQPSPTPTSSSSPTPSPTPTPTATAVPGDPYVNVSVDRSIAQVGQTLTYTITVTNPSSATITPTITNSIASEVQFLSATAQPAPSFGSGSLTWAPTNLAPGATRTLTWQGRVVGIGDLDATNTVTGTGIAPVETHTYLAQVKGVVLHRSPGEPDWGTHEERKVVFTTEERDVTAPDDVAAQSSGALPYTGAPVIPLVVLSALLLLGGCMLMTQRGRRFSAVGLMLVLVAASCTSETPPRDQATQSDEGDEVLGTRIGRDDNEGDGATDTQGNDAAENDTAENDTNDNDNNSGDDTADTGGENSPDDDDPITPADDPAPATGPEEVITRDVVTVEVPNDPPAARSLEPSNADNEIFLDWDAATRSIIGASSRAIFRADSPIQFLTSLREGGGSMSAGVTITNVTDAERLLVDGNFVLTISGSAGSIELTSPRLQQVLDPDDQVSAGFEFALPSGSYEIVATYVTR